VRLLNFNVKSQCTPSRSAIMTGRHAIRSGTHSVAFPGQLDGLTQWEVTIAELLSGQCYATAQFGKWHLGSDQSRLPTRQGFDEWFGIPCTTDEAYWPSATGFKESGVEPQHIMEGSTGEKSRNLEIHDFRQRRLTDAEVTRRAMDFMKRSVKARKPIYAYVAMTQPHLPALPHPDFEGKTGFGNFPDVLAEMDVRVGQRLDAVDEPGVRNDTIFVPPLRAPATPKAVFDAIEVVVASTM
jgi:arylsulfatase